MPYFTYSDTGIEGQYLVSETISNPSRQIQDFRSFYLNFRYGSFVRSVTGISNPRPADFHYVARYDMCRLCVYLHLTNYTTLWTLICTTYCDLTFKVPCIVSIFRYISNKMQRYTLYFWKLLYMFRVVSPPIIRSTYNCVSSIWYLSKRDCYLPLSWKSWNWFECAAPALVLYIYI